jgi:hypothetical protein
VLRYGRFSVFNLQRPRQNRSEMSAAAAEHFILDAN